MMNKPTPKYDAVLKEYKWVNNKLIKFVEKYPDYKEYLTDEEVLFKHRIDYQMLITDFPPAYRRRSYISYFMDKSWDKTKKERENIDNEWSAYSRIRQIIIEDVIPDHQNHCKCGCRRCSREFPAYQFLRREPYLCPKCRGWIKFAKKNKLSLGDKDFNYWYLRLFGDRR